ncbi:hypothetical protein CDD83_9509 [Cordyceps sp. RAO-2017]|nr:hypothetical protein CDD83_9509 [Cordyceps sp. RAO-2017]
MKTDSLSPLFLLSVDASDGPRTTTCDRFVGCHRYDDCRQPTRRPTYANTIIIRTPPLPPAVMAGGRPTTPPTSIVPSPCVPRIMASLLPLISDTPSHGHARLGSGGDGRLAAARCCSSYRGRIRSHPACHRQSTRQNGRSWSVSPTETEMASF